ncbi:MAG: hypothetical protein GY798_09795 [Hyphomicrobiales bacterium]|nr:hypothetical protein [Hyphomicrobiales bacterium]
MTKIEKAKALALSRCRLGHSPWALRFVRGMVWLAEHEPGTVLSAAQKWGLDSCCYTFRRQLAGEPDLEVPASPPVRAAYFLAHDARCASRRVALERKYGKKPEQAEMF